MDEENLRREFVEFLTQYREEIARAACEAVPKAYPYMPSLAGSEETYEWILSELSGLIDAYSRDDAAALEYKGFYAYFVMYSADPFRAFFNYLDGMYFLARFTSSFAYDRAPVKGVCIRSQLKSFEGFVLRVLRGNTQYFLNHVLEPGLILDSLDPAVAPVLLPLQTNQWGGHLKRRLRISISRRRSQRASGSCAPWWPRGFPTRKSPPPPASA